MSSDENIVQESTPAGDDGGPAAALPKTQAEFFARAAEKVRSKFPNEPGVYLFQDQAGRVLYI
ncbi:MAG: excinuclease ABC subunit UvrC, partial [Pirellulales bacterium]